MNPLHNLSPEEQDQLTLEQKRLILANPGEAAGIFKVLFKGSDKILERKKTRRDMKSPYYKEKYARHLKPLLDELLSKRKAVCLRVEDYPQYSAQTLYLRCCQATLYITDFWHLPEEKKYVDLIDDIEIRKYPVKNPTELRFVFYEEDEAKITFKSVNASGNEVVARIRGFLESDDVKRLELPDKQTPFEILYEKDVDIVQRFLDGLTGKDMLTYFVSDDSVIVVKKEIEL